MSFLEPKDYAILAAQAAADKKASDVTVIGVGEILVVADYFLIATGNTDRQVRVIAEEIESQLKEAGLRAIGREGEQEGKWLLVDFGELVIHIFQPSERAFYRLENLWSDAPHLELDPEVVNASGTIESPETVQ